MDYMKEIQFIKMHGLGNSYVYIDRHKNKLDEKQLPALARQLSQSSVGIGSDGLILIEPSSTAVVKMRIFNKDGSEAKNCGNGLRCVAKYAFEQGYALSYKMAIETLSGNVEALIEHHTLLEALVTVNMGPPRLARNAIPMKGLEIPKIVAEPFEILDHKLLLTAVSMGNPHAVFFVSEKNTSLHILLGSAIEQDRRFPYGVNVEFVFVESPTSLHCRVWERGSGVTQACGTGACAVLVAAVINGFSNKDEWVKVHLDGGTLDIKWVSDTNRVWMTGPATTVAKGTILI